MRVTATTPSSADTAMEPTESQYTAPVDCSNKGNTQATTNMQAESKGVRVRKQAPLLLLASALV